MLALLGKEWRENRKLLWAFVVLAPLLSLGLKQLVPDWRVRPDLAFAFQLPAFFALYLMAVGADLVAGDAGSGRLVFLATLPVRPAGIWGAKVLFLLLSAALFLGYALVVESLIFSVAGADLWLGYTDWAAGAMSLGLSLGFALAAAVVLWSTLIDHGLAAVLGALLTLGLLALVAFFLALSKYEFRAATTESVACLLAVPAIVFVLASGAAFALGRVHLGGRLRRVAIAAATVVLFLGAPVAAAAHLLARWAEIRPGDADVRYGVHERMVAPDGRWAVVHAGHGAAGPFGATPGRNAAGATFAVNLEDGRVRDLTGLGFAMFDPFPEPGVLRLRRPEPTEDGKLTLEVRYDLAEGATISTRPLPRDWRAPWTWELGRWRIRWDGEGPLVLREGREPLRLLERASVWTGHGPVGVVSRDPEGRYRLHLVESGREVALPAGPWSQVLVPSSETGRALGVRRTGADRHEIVSLPLDGGPEEVRLDAGASRLLTESPDGRRALLLVEEPAALLVLDADRGIRSVPWSEVEPPSELAWSRDSDRFLLGTEGRWVLGDLSGPAPVLEPVDLGIRHAAVVWFDGRRALALTARRGSLLLLEPGEEPRQLLPAR